jgi:hypothetical protein
MMLVNAMNVVSPCAQHGRETRGIKVQPGCDVRTCMCVEYLHAHVRMWLWCARTKVLTSPSPTQRARVSVTKGTHVQLLTQLSFV